MNTTTETYTDNIVTLFSQLFGADVPVQKLSESLPFESNFICASYANESGDVCKTILLDCSLANRAGAALTMIPARTADESIKSNRIEESVFANLSEVLNICVNILGESNDHLVLKDVFSIPESEQSFNLTTSESFKVELEKYGDGVLTVADVDPS